jgi:hypothetical protein
LIEQSGAPGSLRISRVNTLQDLIQRTEWLQHQVHEQQQTLDRLSSELTRHREALYAHLGEPQHPAAITCCNADEPEPITSTDQDASDADRRSLPRRRGNPIPVVIRRSATDPDHFSGWVIDRSPEGLCILAEKEVNVGGVLSIRPTHHAEAPRWFSVRVRNCRLERSAWILGCQFVQELSWDELRLFN